MTSGQFWIGKHALRPQFSMLRYTDVNGTLMNDKSSALHLITLSRGCRVFMIDNSTNIDLDIWVLHPESVVGAGNANLLYFINIGYGRSWNLDVTGNIGITLEAGIQFWITKNTAEMAAATSGAVRVFAWG